MMAPNRRYELSTEFRTPSNLALENGLLRRRMRAGKLLVKRQHGINKHYYAVVSSFIGLPKKVDSSYWERFNVLLCAGDPAAAKNVTDGAQTPKEKF